MTGHTRRAALSDVAREAGVSLATVDRVLHQRPGVHPRTTELVQAAVQRLNYRPDPAATRLARQRRHRVCFVLPAGSNSFIGMLRDQLAENRAWMDDQRLVGEMVEVDVFEPRRLADGLHALKGHCDTAVVMALDHPLVRAAIDALSDDGMTVITLVSDVPSSRRKHFVGIDNVAAGRTAAALIGRFVRATAGEVGVLVGSLSLRDHADRYFGFNQVMSDEYPGLKLLPPIEGKDDSRSTAPLVAELLVAHPRLRAIYSVGAGNRGISAALQASGRAKQVVFVGHELTSHARGDLLSGTMDAVISQNPGHELRSALRLALAGVTREPVQNDQERVGIDIYLKDNLP